MAGDEAAMDALRKAAAAWGRQGGKLRWRGVSAEQRREIARNAARARWAKGKKT